MTEHGFDQPYWEQHWQQAHPGAGGDPNPHLVREAGALPPGTALDAGCGEGAEALWLAAQGWTVTAADVSAQALARAAARAEGVETPGSVEWVRADLTTWSPAARFDLVTTHYAHPTTTQTEFYERLAGWVAPGGTLLIVGHRHTPDGGHGQHGRAHGHGQPHGHAQRPPAEASATLAGVTALLDPAGWEIVTAEERSRAVPTPDGGRTLDDVVVRATRR